MIEDKVEKPDKKDDGIAKQVANMAYTIRKMKNWMEDKLGADIDGDGKVGSSPKRAVVFLLALGIAAICSAANTNIEVWAGTEAAPTAGVHADGGIFGAYFSGNGAAITNLTGTASVNGTTLNALNLANCTNLPSGGVVSLDSAKLTGNIPVARLTNAVGVTAATITITNYGVGNIYGTNVITFFGTVSYP